MFLIVGLGNPTKQYEKTRHNIGFDVMDALADKYNISISENKHKALCGKGVIEGMKVVLAKPQTYMNLSGESVAELVNYYKLDPESELIVVFDDISLEPGNIRIRKKGSAGGHNGIKNIIAQLVTDTFQRIKVGILCASKSVSARSRRAGIWQTMCWDISVPKTAPKWRKRSDMRWMQPF